VQLSTNHINLKNILLLNELSFEKLLVTHVGRRLNPITKIKLAPARFSRVVTDCITIRVNIKLKII
jgi:hypothetical protein